MTQNTQHECLFIGGSAAGKHLAVDSTQLEIHLPSLSHQPALQDPAAKAADNDPVPDESKVVEIYLRLDVEAGDRPVVVYALNSLSAEAIDVQITKHFGTTDPAPLM
jgi:hypothetical protein